MTGSARGPAPRLSDRVGRAFFDAFTELRPAQEAALGPILAGQDALIRAGTGSGKTEAATAPLVERHLKALDHTAGVTLLYLSPTRALANDLLRRLEPVFDRLHIDVGVRHGERDDVNRAVSPRVLITTPESLDVMVGKQQEALRTVQAVVIDEIHLLMNTQRGLQLAVAVHRLELWIGHPLQVVGLSATLGDPFSVWGFFRPQTQPTIIDDDSADRATRLQIRLKVTPKALAGLMRRLSPEGPAKILVFTNSRRLCDTVAEELRSSSGFDEHVFAHHASLSRDERLLVEREFEAQPRAVCVATSTLELGIDIGDINLAVLYGVPASWQSYLQRLGRANRRSAHIDALASVPDLEDGKPTRLRDQLGFQALHSQVEMGAHEAAKPFRLYGAAAQQVASMIQGGGGAFVGINRLIEILSPWPHLDPATVELMLDELVAHDVLIRHPVYRRYGAGDRLWELRDTMQIWSNLPLGSRDIDIRQGGSPLGSIPTTNLLQLKPGAVFTFASRRWKVAGIGHDGITVVPSTGAVTATLSYARSGAPLDPALADHIRVLLDKGDVGAHVVPAAEREGLVARLAPLQRYAADDVLPFAVQGAQFVYLTFAGKLANRVLARWALGDDATADELCVTAPAPISFESLPTDPLDLVDLLDAAAVPSDQLSEFQRLLPPELRRQELINEWLQRPVHERILHRLASAEQVRMPSHLLERL